MSIAEEQYRALFEQANEGIFIADGEGRYLDVNRAGCQMLGYTKEEITGMTIADVITEDETSALPRREKREDGKGASTITGNLSEKISRYLLVKCPPSCCPMAGCRPL